MRLLAVLLLLASGLCRAHAQALPAATLPGAAATETGVTAAGFDAPLAAAIFGRALAFLAPRTLDPVGSQQLASWGLGGVAALDPSLTARVADGQVLLLGTAGTLYAAVMPAPDDVSGWGGELAAVLAAGWRVSPAIRAAGTEGAVVSVFDEMFNHLDPYSRYVPPSAAVADRDERFGTGGPGLSVLRSGARFLVGGVTDGGPADRAGIAPGERILAVDGQSLRDADLARVTDALQGQPGTTLTLLLSAGARRQRIVLTREAIPPQTVFTERQGDLLVLRIAGFASDTAEQVSEQLEAALQDGAPPAALVLDLRGDRGGLLRQAVTTVALLLNSGTVVTTEGRDPAAGHVWRVQGGDLTNGLPLVVLVDGRTASAAEIAAAAIADNGRGVVVGSATLGKGLVQTVAAMPGGGELFVTWSRVLAPGGWPLQGLGVLPQVCTSLGEAAMDASLEALDAGRQPLAAALATERNSRPPITPARQLAIRDACPAAIGTSLDLQAAAFLASHRRAYQTALLRRP